MERRSWSRQAHTMRMLCSLGLVLLLATPVAAQRPSSKAPLAPAETSQLASTRSVEPQEGAPVAVARTRQYDLTSKINGRIYRVFVSTPWKADPAKAYPVMYVLDGNLSFAPTAIEVDNRAAAERDMAAIVVGIGYPTDDIDVLRTRRNFELTMSARPGDKEGQSGGGDVFLRVLEEEVKPFVAARYKIDRTKQTLWGYSLGGLMVLRQMFRHPEGYSTYVAASPSIWWNNREVLTDEATFVRRAKAGDVHVRILLTSAGDEQYRGDDAKRRAAADNSRMIDNASELAGRLASVSPANVTVARVIFPEETHASVPLASLARAVTFALKP